jgi:hypothetical protein
MGQTAIVSGPQFLGNDAICQRPMHDFGTAPAEDALGGGVPVHDVSVQIHEHDGIERGIENGPAVLLAAPQSLGGGPGATFLAGDGPTGGDEQPEEQDQSAVEHERGSFAGEHEPGIAAAADEPAQGQQEEGRTWKGPAQEDAIRPGRENAAHGSQFGPRGEHTEA